jgi:hypothetical protein
LAPGASQCIPFVHESCCLREIIRVPQRLLLVPSAHARAPTRDREDDDWDSGNARAFPFCFWYARPRTRCGHVGASAFWHPVTTTVPVSSSFPAVLRLIRAPATSLLRCYNFRPPSPPPCETYRSCPRNHSACRRRQSGTISSPFQVREETTTDINARFCKKCTSSVPNWRSIGSQFLLYIRVCLEMEDSSG